MVLGAFVKQLGDQLLPVFFPTAYFASCNTFLIKLFLLLFLFIYTIISLVLIMYFPHLAGICSFNWICCFFQKVLFCTLAGVGGYKVLVATN